jgi:hypothetical protein
MSGTRRPRWDAKPRGVRSSFPKKTDLFIKEHLAQVIKEHLAQVLSESKRRALGEALKVLWNFTSIVNHPAPPGHFSRPDAELCIRLAGALLSYSGEIMS